MAIYFMTLLFALFLAGKHKKELAIPIEKPKAKMLLFSAGLTVCGIPVAMLLNALAGLFSTSGADTVEVSIDMCKEIQTFGFLCTY